MTHFRGFSKEERLRKNSPIVFKTGKPATCQSVNVAASAVFCFLFAFNRYAPIYNRPFFIVTWPLTGPLSIPGQWTNDYGAMVEKLPGENQTTRSEICTDTMHTTIPRGVP
jgi:hypothetical protein